MKTLRLILALGLLACAAPVTKAGPGGCTTAPWMSSIGQEAITVTNASIGFTSTLAYPSGGIEADIAVAIIETDNIRTRADGIAPTASVGQLFGPTASAGATFSVCGLPNIKKFRMIRQTTDATVTVEYYRQGP